MTSIQAWLEERVASFSPQSAGARALGDLGAIEQLVKAWRGFSGKSGSVFGMVVPPSWEGTDLELVKGRILAALEQWLTVLSTSEAAELTSRLHADGIKLGSAVGTEVEPAVPQATVAGAVTAQDVEALAARLASMPERVSAERWTRLVGRWQQLANFLATRPDVELHQPLEILPALSLEEIAEVQGCLDRQIPDELLYVAAHFSGGVRFGWNYDLRSLVGKPAFPLNRLVAGQGGAPKDSAGLFDISALPGLLGCRDWEQPDETTAWSTVIPLFQYESDYVAIDTADPHTQPVVYMSHEEGCRHPPLAGSFMDFLELWTSVLLIDIERYAESPCLEEQGFAADAPALRAWGKWWGDAGNSSGH